MSNTIIQLRKSSVPNEVPSDLEFGEIAINYADGKFYYKNSTGQIVSFIGSGNVYSFATINANNSLITAISNNSVLSIVPGQNIGITSDIINDIITISANLSPAFVVANAAFDEANLVSNITNTVFIVANAAFAAANSTLGIGSFPIGDYAAGEPVIGQGGGVDAFGVPLIVTFDCAQAGSLQYSDLGLLT